MPPFFAPKRWRCFKKSSPSHRSDLQSYLLPLAHWQRVFLLWYTYFLLRVCFNSAVPPPIAATPDIFFCPPCFQGTVSNDPRKNEPHLRSLWQMVPICCYVIFFCFSHFRKSVKSVLFFFWLKQRVNKGKPKKPRLHRATWAWRK